MTSSLVGSEMCIRDREMVVRPVVTFAGGSLWNIRSTYSASVDIVGPKKAVSYTHLTLPTICSV
eukprot:1103308-Prorocentrum_lima.AAC.1